MDLRSVTIVFRDNTSLTVTEANWAASMRLLAMEEQAVKEPVEWPAEQLFRQGIYPKLAACSSGQVPSVEEALNMPTTELDKWYEAAKEMNSHWFNKSDGQETEEELKKKELSPTESTPV